MRIKALVLSVVVAGGLLAGIPRSGGLAHAAPSAARSAAPSAARSAATCPTTVLGTIPLYNHVTIHGYASLIRNLCDGNVFLRVSTDAWWSTVNGELFNLSGLGGDAYAGAFLPFGGYADSPEIPYVSGATYSIIANVDSWGTIYSGSAWVTAP